MLNTAWHLSVEYLDCLVETTPKVTPYSCIAECYMLHVLGSRGPYTS